MTKTKAHKAKYTEIKQEYSDRLGKLLDECGVFWAFSNEQLAEGKLKNPLSEGEKYASIGAGGYLPNNNIDKLNKGSRELKAWEKQAMKAVDADEAILYELNNYECFYTGEITDALEVLEEMGYTAEQVRAVYRANNNKTDWIN